MDDGGHNQNMDGSVFRTDPKEILFRSSALERLAVREDLDELFMAGRRRIWVLLPALVMLLASFVVWLIDW